MTLTPEQAMSGLETLRRQIDEGRRAPMGETLDFQLIEIDEGVAVFAASPAAKTYNPQGTVHGGYSAALLDSACGCAVHSCLSAEQGYTTIELKVSYHRPITIKTGPVRAEAKVISIGKRIAFTEGRLTDMSGRLYASATSTLLVLPR
ncbi:PaaI family thioesterase [Caballeronia sp. SEWSISQ10-4 2]|uniref:PaaI family thioesterase n=1 Tax=Caballeronia sp. SEWSISQ10-4 2 TaxID=2937438 RepID=UPI00264C434B|nr:PaaI family thioesterase [Caballeronia sp. SEWSISQ10-4 2]MDN7179025.1 PaaI family thioesterase [Caballeronia sp. SEWSISQ10-4 2]